MAEFLTKTFPFFLRTGKLLLPLTGLAYFVNFLFLHTELYYLVIPIIVSALFISRGTGEYQFFFNTFLLSLSAYLLLLFPISGDYLKALIWGIVSAQVLIESAFDEQLAYLSQKFFSGNSTAANTIIAVVLPGILMIILASGGVSMYPEILRYYSGPSEYLYYVIIAILLISGYLRFHSWGQEWILLTPVTVAMVFSVSLLQTSPDFLKQVIFGILLAIGVSSIAAMRNSLEKSGMYAAALLGFYTFGFGGIKWAIPLLVFFLTSSILTKVRESKNKEMDIFFEKTGPRDRMQVYANGGIGIVLIILYYFYREELFYRIFVIYLAAACADTWATEIGGLFRRTTISIRSFRKVKVGESGGVSLPGTFAALAGAAIVGVSGMFLTDDAGLFVSAAVCGFLGSIVDSLLGATLQVQYKCTVCAEIVEKNVHCGKTTLFMRGYKFINNDFVNIAGGSAAVIFYLLFTYTVL